MTVCGFQQFQKTAGRISKEDFARALKQHYDHAVYVDSDL
jgi:hypothetical protein